MRLLARSLPVLILALAAACAPAEPPPPLSPDPELDAFARQVQRDLEAHDWQAILTAADPDHYRVQVVEGGMGEPQYVAELFGLHHVDNNIRRGETVTWTDLERIDAVSLERADRTGDRFRLYGSVDLADGGSLDLRATILARDGAYRLTGGVG